jgi:drug/metabolite transporter (DMT)-like permease
MVIAFGLTDLLLILMAVIWGVNFSAVKYATGFLSPGVFTVLRLATAAVTFMFVARLQRNPWPTRSDVVRLMGLGVVGNGIYQLFFANGLARTRVADAALIMAAAPALIAVASHVRGFEKISARAISGIVLSIVGVGIVITGSATIPQRTGTMLGAAFMMAAVLCWTTFTVALRPLTARVDGVQLNAFTMLGGMLPMLFFVPELVQTNWGIVPPRVWGCVLYAGAISMGVAYLFYMRGIRVLGPTRTAIYGNLQPLVATLVAWALLHEAPTPWQITGATFIVSGILLTRL